MPAGTTGIFIQMSRGQSEKGPRFDTGARAPEHSRLLAELHASDQPAGGWNVRLWHVGSATIARS